MPIFIEINDLYISITIAFLPIFWSSIGIVPCFNLSPIKMRQYEKDWIAKLEVVLEENISTVDFYLTDVAILMGTSTAQLNRNINRLLGISPRLYIRDKKLAKAKELLEIGTYPTVKEVSLAVGYKHVTHFTTIFYEKFGKKPITYLKGISQNE